jgi:hypothetical protein
MTRKKATFFHARSILILFLVIFFVADFLFSQEQSPTLPEVKIIARSWEKTKDRVFASGNVEVHYKNIKLFADKIELNTETKDVYAEGNVVLQSPGEVVSVEKIFFNLDSSQGKLEKAFGMIQPTIFYEAESIEKKAENVYSFRKARLTSCTQPVPRWNFSCSRANFKKGDYLEMWNTVLSIKKIPIFYFPYLRYPLDKERATGFLMPQLGYSGPKGISYSQSFYWVIKRNMDSTFNLDYYSTRGLGAGMEFRYLFSRGTGGQLNAYYFIFKKDPERENPSHAYLFRFNHNQPLPLNFSLVADVDYQSSFDFLREFDNNFRRAVVSNRRSQVYLSRAWSSFNLNMRASRFETYFAEINDSIITYNLPQISLNSFKIKLFSPLYFSFSSSFSRWQNGWQSAYKKNKETRSQSIAFSPSLSLPFTKIPWLTLNSSFETNLIYYFQTYAPRTRKIVDEPLFSRNYTLNFELVGPVFSRIYYGKDGTARLKHIIEPSASYSYGSPIASPERIITPYYRYFRLHQISYGLTNHFLIKQGEMPREVFTFGLAETFYLAPEDSPLSMFLVDGKIPKFSEISSYMRFYPAAKYSLDFAAGFNPYYKTFSSVRLGANMGSPTDSLFLAVSWFKSVNAWYKGTPMYELGLWDRHQISCFAGAKIPKLSLEAQTEFDFNIVERKMLYSAFAFVYHYQCLDFRADLRIFYFREKPETQFRLSIGLGNIGKTVDFLGGMGF